MSKSILHRFIRIGTKEEMDKLNSLAEEKNLSKDDLTLILRAIKLNPTIAADTIIEKMADDFSRILSSAHIPE